MVASAILGSGLTAERCSSLAWLPISSPRPTDEPSSLETLLHLRTFADGGQIFFALLDRLHLLKHVSHAHQVVVKDILGHVKKPEQSRVGNGVIHIAPSFASDHDVPHSQNRKLLRNVRGFNLQNFAEFIDPFSPSRRQSKIRIRMGCARALKNSALKLAICCGMLILWDMHTVICEVYYVKS